MGRRRPFIALRKRVFVGCEGESERGYVALIQQLVDDRELFQNLALHLDSTPLNPGAGDPEQLVRRAILKIAEDQKRRGRGEAYAFKAVFLDKDRFYADQVVGDAAFRLAAQHNIHLVLQDPKHEGMLLRHLANWRDKIPSNCDQALKREWPQYQKTDVSNSTR